MFFEQINKPEENCKIEKTIIFLVNSIINSGNNPKPVITHCIRVAFKLDESGCQTDIVISALLHDLLEDSDIRYEDIKKEFSTKIAETVRLLTFDETILDKDLQYKKNFDSLLKNKDALIIRCVDLLDNSNYYRYVKDKDTKKYIRNKLDYFLKVARKQIGTTKFYKQLKRARADIAKL